MWDTCSAAAENADYRRLKYSYQQETVTRLAPLTAECPDPPNFSFVSTTPVPQGTYGPTAGISFLTATRPGADAFRLNETQAPNRGPSR